MNDARENLRQGVSIFHEHKVSRKMAEVVFVRAERLAQPDSVLQRRLFQWIEQLPLGLYASVDGVGVLHAVIVNLSRSTQLRRKLDCLRPPVLARYIVLQEFGSIEVLGIRWHFLASLVRASAHRRANDDFSELRSL